MKAIINDVEMELDFKLLPCPVCGAKDPILYGSSRGYYVKCEAAKCSMWYITLQPSAKAAINLWNSWERKKEGEAE